MKILCKLLFTCCFISGLLQVNIAFGQGKKENEWGITYHFASKDTSFNNGVTNLQTLFANEAARFKYADNLPALLLSRGYPLANVDSTWMLNSTLHLLLYLGPQYFWSQLYVDQVEPEALDKSGYRNKKYSVNKISTPDVLALQERLLQYYEKSGYPFASVRLDSIQFSQNGLSAHLLVDKSVRYHVDSIHVVGGAKINRKFLQRYLGIENGSLYDASRLLAIDKRIAELSFVKAEQPSDVSLLGAGAVLNLYLQPKKSSQVDAIIGFLPSAGVEKKLQVTADVLLDLTNLLGNGENILVKWQQLQQKSPRLNFGFTYPYIFNSDFGINFLFDLFKKDSSFLQLNAQAGVQFSLSTNQTGKLYVQWQAASLLEGGVDTNLVKAQKKLPENIDVKAVNGGLDYAWNNTDYRYSPRRGNELDLRLITGIKTIQRNNDVVNIKDVNFNYATLYDSLKLKSYQLRLVATAARYFPLAGLSVLKAGFSGGYYSSPTIFRNELFQVGGYRLLRGFDEQSIYATKYLVSTL
ncbi:MAG: BamA/TamA family outer membrane protein, partial [Ferruginibacter sp.]